MRIAIFAVTLIMSFSIGYALNGFTGASVCTVQGEFEQPACGDMFLLNIDGVSVSLPMERCVNFNDVEVGDTFKAVTVEWNNELLSVTRIGG